MARKRKTWKQAVQSDARYADWTFGSGPVRSVDTKRYEDAVSRAIKAYGRWERYDVALKFARRMRAKAQLVRELGCDSAYIRMQAQPGSFASMTRDGRSFSRPILNAMCWGVGDGNNRVMIMRYEACAKAAERFCRR